MPVPDQLPWVAGIGYFILKATGVEARYYLDRDTRECDRIDLDYGAALPTIQTGAFAGYDFRKALKLGRTEEELAVLLAAHMLGSEAVAELAGSRRQ